MSLTHILLTLLEVAISELEALLPQHSAVKDAGDIGTIDLLAGELSTAFVLKQPGVEVTEKEICNFVAAKIDGITGEKAKFGDMAQEVVNIAASLTRLGVKPGEVVAMCSENRREFFTTTIAVCYIGATATFINCNYSKSEVIHTTNISKPKYIFLSLKTYETYYETVSNLGFIKEYFIFGNNKNVGLKRFIDLASKHVDINSFQPTDVKGSDTAIIVYSSGTTGLPKGAIWTHLGLIVCALHPMYEPDRDLVFLTIAPWTNTAGYGLTMVTLLKGKTVVFLPKFEEKLYLQTIEKYKVGYLLTVPSLVVILSKSFILDNYDVSSVEIIHSGGATLETNVLLDVKKRFPNLKCTLQGYGMTESTGGLTQETELENKIGSVGKILLGLMLKIVDIETRNILGPHKPGELCFKGSVLFGGYVNKESPDDYDEEGFYKTGDIAYYDENGYFFIVDRLKELIKYKSWQVAPSELEALLLQHPAVKDAGVIGTPNSLAGELPTAFVVKQPGVEVTEKEICNFVAAKVSPWKRLRGGVRFVNEIPKNGSGKILRRILRDMLKPLSKL